MHVLRARSASSRRMPHGAWNGVKPAVARSSDELLDARLVATRPARDTACSRHPPSDPRRGCRGPGTATRPSCSTARSRRRSSGQAGESRRRGCSSPKSSGRSRYERGAVELRGPADEVVHLRLERLAVVVVPRLRGDVLALLEDRLGRPVVRLARQEVASLQHQDLLARRCQGVCEGAAPGSRADDDDVVAVRHRILRSVRRPTGCERHRSDRAPGAPARSRSSRSPS